MSEEFHDEIIHMINVMSRVLIFCLLLMSRGGTMEEKCDQLTNELSRVCVLQEELLAVVRRLCEALLQELRRLLEEQQQEEEKEEKKQEEEERQEEEKEEKQEEEQQDGKQ